MEFGKEKLETIKNALQYAVLNAKTEQETAEFALLLIDVEFFIIRDKEREKYLNTLSSLEGCPFNYCDSKPKCENNCRHNNN